MIELKLHPSHVHIIELDEVDGDRDTVLGIPAFKLLVSKFLTYYREGYTETEVADPPPLESAWQYLPPKHISPNGDFYAYRWEFYQFVEQEELFEICYTPPVYSKEKIEKLRKDFAPHCPKEWIEKVRGFALAQIKAVQGLHKNLTKETGLAYLRLRGENCSSMPICQPLLRLAITQLGGPIDMNDPEWHQACPIYSVCIGATDTIPVLDSVQDALSLGECDPDKVPQEVLELIKELHDGLRLTDLPKINAVVDTWQG